MTSRNPDGTFPKGTSGNMGGRPRKGTEKKSRARVGSVDDAIADALSEKVAIPGKRKPLSKLQITATQLANKGAGGDLKAAKMALDYASKAEQRASEADPPGASMTTSDHEIVTRFIARILKIQAEGGLS